MALLFPKVSIIKTNTVQLEFDQFKNTLVDVQGINKLDNLVLDITNLRIKQFDKAALRISLGGGGAGEEEKSLLSIGVSRRNPFVCTLQGQELLNKQEEQGIKTQPLLHDQLWKHL